MLPRQCVTTKSRFYCNSLPYACQEKSPAHEQLLALQRFEYGQIFRLAADLYDALELFIQLRPAKADGDGPAVGAVADLPADHAGGEAL